MSVGTRLGIDQAAQATDTEITLGTGKLLGIFFSLAVVCALFFGLGFNLGRGSAPQPDPNVAVAVPTSATKGESGKPSAGHALGSVSCPAGQICSDSAATETTTPPTVPPEGVDAPAATTPTNATASSTTPVTQPSSVPNNPQPTTATANPATSTSNPNAGATTSFVVQVAAVSRQEDADALTIALRKKNYPAFVVSDLPDKLYHIQVGPFDDRKAATDTRDKLSADGYNPIIK